MTNENADGLVPIWLRQLTALEGSINGIANYVNEHDEDEPPPLEAILVQRDTLRVLFDQATGVLLRIEGAAGPSERRAPLMTRVMAAQTKLCRWARYHDIEQRPPPRQTIDPVLDTTMGQGFARADHLPRLELPRFTRFERRIATLTEDAEKFAFLLKCLEKFEPARNMCEALENSGLSFNEVWAKLEERFYKKRLAFEGHFAKAIKLKKVSEVYTDNHRLDWHYDELLPENCWRSTIITQLHCQRTVSRPGKGKTG